MGQITLLLEQLADGDRSALDSLLPLVYDELRRLARVHLGRERPDHTLSPTALVHEVFLRLVGREPIRYQSRAHFFAVTSTAMRSILIDHARRRLAQKRRPHDPIVTFVAGKHQRTATPDEILDVDVALKKMEDRHKRQATVVELLFFGGLTQSQIATVLGVSVATVQRDWHFARAWLSRELGSA